MVRTMRKIVRALRNRWIMLRNPNLRIGEGANVLPGTVFSKRADVRIGRDTFVGQQCWLSGDIEIGRWVMFAGRVACVGDDHPIDVVGVPMIKAGRPKLRKLTVGDDAWVGYGAVLMMGINIGEGAVVGAYSVVTKDVEPYTIVAGIPARPVRKRFDNPEDERRHREALQKLRDQG